MPLRAWRMGLVSSVLVELEGHPSGGTLSHVSSQVGGVRRPESGVVGWAGPGGRARADRWPAVAGPGAPVGADRQGCERGSQGGLAGRGNGRRRRQHRGHGPAVDDTIIEAHGHAKQGAGFACSGVRGLNALLATVTTTDTAPVVVAQRLRKGSCGSPRGAKRLVTDALKTVRGLTDAKPLVRADAAFYGRGLVLAAVRAGADVSLTVRLDPTVKAAIAAITEDAWQTIEYPDAVFDETTGRWISRAEVAEIEFTAFSGQKRADRVPAGWWSPRSPTPTRERAHGRTP